MHPLDSRIDRKKTELCAEYDTKHPHQDIDGNYVLDRRRWVDERLHQYINSIDKK